jgi:hypothetical protein
MEMEALHFPHTLVNIYQTTICQLSEDSIFHSHSCKTLKFHKVDLFTDKKESGKMVRGKVSQGRGAKTVSS